jgi:glycerol-3-phosphate dehydrogenase
MLLPDGAQPQLDRVRSIAQPELGWNDARWQSEVARYLKIYRAYYSPEPTGLEK